MPNRALLAPMAGLTDAPFRTIAANYGAALVVSEMIASASLVCGQVDMVRRLNKNTEFLHKKNMPHIVQLVGNDEEWLKIGAKIVADAGADIIDINFGCPAKRVVNGFAGAALMKDAGRAFRILDALANATNLPISCKMRLGWDDNNINVVQIAKLAQNAGAQMIVVHARTRQQFYKGKARWELVAPVVKALNVPVIINGDIVDEKSAKLALQKSNAAGIMIGRAALGAPWLVGQIGAALQNKETMIKTPNKRQLKNLILEHYQNILSEYGTYIGVRVARKHLRYYMQRAQMTIDKNIMRELLTEQKPNNVKNKIKEIFREQTYLAA